MARKRSLLLSKPVLAAALIVVAWLVLPVAVRRFFRAGFYEFQAPIWTAWSIARDLQDYWVLRLRPRAELIEAGRDLARLNAAYEVRLQEASLLENEIDHLEAFLDLPPLTTFRAEPARVVRRDMNAWWQRLTIRKGRNFGLKPGAAVIFSGGVVGRIGEVHAFTSTVDLVSDPRFRMAAHIGDDRRPVTYQGEINRSFSVPFGRVRNVQLDVAVTPATPRRVVSSRLGGVFPDGLTVGWIDRLEPSADGLFQEGRLRLHPELLSVREVAVLIPVEDLAE